MLIALLLLHQFIIRTLEAHNVPYDIAHSASGVGGLQLALAAGLGVSCLNASAVPQGIRRYDGALRLPSLPDVEFSLLPPRRGEPTIVTEVRKILAEHLP
jgi:DNA-binding transcriptional LysR family regulator